MAEIEIAQNGEVTVDPSIKGGFADPTLPLADRLGILAEGVARMNFDGVGKAYLLILEASDVVRSNRTAAERRAATQRKVQDLLQHSQAEIRFLRRQFEKLGHKAPDFVAPSPYEGSGEAYKTFVLQGSEDGGAEQT